MVSNILVSFTLGMFYCASRSVPVNLQCCTVLAAETITTEIFSAMFVHSTPPDCITN